DVGTAGETGAPAESVALDPPDDRSRAVPDRVQHLPEPPVVLDVFVVGELDRRALPTDVGARAEALPFAGEDHDARVADVAECACEVGDQSGVEGVPALRPVERDAEDIPVALGPDRCHWECWSFAINALTIRSTSASSWPKSSR